MLPEVKADATIRIPKILCIKVVDIFSSAFSTHKCIFGLALRCNAFGPKRLSSRA